MELLYDVLFVLHLAGMLALVGGWLVVLVTRRVDGRAALVMQRGGEAQVLTGPALVGLGAAALDRDYDYVKITVKLVVAVSAVALVSVANGRRGRGGSTPAGLVHAAGGLGVTNLLVAVLWN